MPLHQSHHHHGNHPCQVSGNTSCCSPCCCSCSCNSSSASPLPPIPSDLLQAMAAAQILQTQSLLRPQQLTKDHHYTQSLLHNLINRVAALESALSTAPPPPPLQFPPRRRRPSPPPPLPSPSVREVAARTIQALFRRFLVRRSQTLRDLKRLASIKSNVAALRSKISGNAGAEPEDLSQKAMDMLLQLDSIQSFDPMIRDGKRSISRELSRMLDFIDKILVRERRFPLRELAASEEKSVPAMPRARSAKIVSFADHVDDSKVFSRVLEEEEEGFSFENVAISQVLNGGFGLSAPLPVQMEPRVGL